MMILVLVRQIQGNVSHIVPTIHPHVKIGQKFSRSYTRFREAAASVHGDQL